MWLCSFVAIVAELTVADRLVMSCVGGNAETGDRSLAGPPMP